MREEISPKYNKRPSASEWAKSGAVKQVQVQPIDFEKVKATLKPFAQILSPVNDFRSKLGSKMGKMLPLLKKNRVGASEEVKSLNVAAISLPPVLVSFLHL